MSKIKITCYFYLQLNFFQVNARWLLDLDEYNEWMNVDDYEVEMDALVSRCEL